MTTLHSRESIDRAAKEIRDACDLVPDISLILGTGLGGLANEIDCAAEIP